MKTLLSLTIVLGIVVLLASPSYAVLIGDPVFPTITGNVITLPDGQGVNAPLGLEEFECDLDSGKWKLKGELEYTIDGAAGIVVEEIEFDPDPTVTVDFSVTNLTDAVQTYSFTVTLPSTPGAYNLRYGRIITDVLDGTAYPGDSATVAAPENGSIYNAQIDGAVVRTLQDYDFELTAPALGANSAEDFFALEANGVAVTQDIGITLNFTLTPGDMASFLARFDVIPEPATLTLFGLGTLLLRRRRRL